MKIDVLTNKNFILYCAKVYDNPQCMGIEEFKEDLQRIKYIKKLLTRYIQSGELKERLILNHIIILNNVFGPEATCRILLLKMRKYMPYLKPFLLLLKILPERITNVEKARSVYYTDDVTMDKGIIEVLRKI